MKKKAKIITFLALILLVVLVVVANVMRGRSLVRSVQVSIDYPGADTLVTAQQVVKLVSDSLPSLSITKAGDTKLYISILSRADFTAEAGSMAISDLRK